MECQSSYLKILLLLFPAPCQVVLESCFAERLFLAAQLNFPGSRRVLLLVLLIQQVSSTLSNPEKLLLSMPTSHDKVVNHLILCFLES